jgi:tetratricopeptide (TPR) repeat protein
MSHWRKPRPANKPATTGPSAPAMAGPRFPVWLMVVFFVGLMLLVYWPAMRGGYIWDDDEHLTKNPCIVGPLGFKDIWTSRAARICPLVQTTFWVEHKVWGLNPLPYHLVNVLIHAAAAMVLWRVLRRLKVPGAWLGAALWALHPVQVESVAWITELKNIQSALFFLLAILFFARSVTAEQGPDGGRGWRFYALALVAGLLAMASKSSTVILPLVLGLCAWWLERRWRWGNVLKLAPFFLMAAAASALSIWTQRLEGAAGPEWERSWSERFIVAGKVVWFYLGKLAWPRELTFIYPRWEVDAMRLVSYLPTLAVVLVLGVLWWKRGSWGRQGFFALGYFLAALLPVLGLVNHYFLLFSFVGDHFQYLASLGAMALAGAWVARLLTRLGLWERARGQALCGVPLLALAVLSWRQCGVYHDNETLWRDTLAKNPACWMARCNLGVTLSDKGEIDEAVSHYREALRLKPDYAKAWYNLGNAFVRKGQTDEAVSHYKEAIRLEPAYADAYNNLGAALLKQGRTDEAIRQYREALRLKPDAADTHNGLGIALRMKGQTDEAIRQFQEVIRLKSDDAQARYNLGVVLGMKGQTDEAIRQYEEAIRLNPDDAQARNNLGSALLNQGHLDEAISQYQEAIRLQPGYAEAHSNLGSALGMKSKTDEAIRQFQEAIRLEPNSAGFRNNLGIILGANGQIDEAISQYQEAIRLKPDYTEARDNLARARAMKSAPAGR